MNLLNNIMLRLGNNSLKDTLIIIATNFIICLIISAMIMIAGYLISLKIGRTEKSVKHSLSKYIRYTLHIFIWMYFVKQSIDLLAQIYLREYSEQIDLYTHNMLLFLLNIAIIISIFKFLNKAKEITIEKSRSKTQGYSDFRDINAIFKVFDLVTIVIAIILILVALDVPLTALGAFSGVAFAGLTLSQSTLITNFFGGVVVVFNRKYSEGDIISSSTNSSIKFAGTIKKIGIITTQVDSYDTTPIHVPNSAFLSTCITNNSRRTHRRIVQNITIGYQYIDKIQIIKQEIKDMLKSHSDVDNTKTIAVSLLSGGTAIGTNIEGSFGNNGINIQIYAMIKKVFYNDFLEAQDDIFLNIAQILKNHKVDFAINPITVKIENENITKTNI